MKLLTQRETPRPKRSRSAAQAQALLQCESSHACDTSLKAKSELRELRDSDSDVGTVLGPCTRGKRFGTVRAFPRIHDPNLLLRCQKPKLSSLTKHSRCPRLPLVPSQPSRFWCPPLSGRRWWWIHLSRVSSHRRALNTPALPGFPRTPI